MSDRSLIWVTPTDCRAIEATQDLPANVGAKARGLLWLPSAWTPDFFVLAPDFHAAYIAATPRSRLKLVESWADRFAEGAAASGLNSVDHLYLRSNAISELLADRGKYQSVHCAAKDWAKALHAFFEAATKVDRTPIGVVVQRYIPPLASGHLSNERRVAEEYRDAVAELVDEASGQMSEARLSYRKWRQAKAVDIGALICGSASEVTQVLREPLALAATHMKRIHFEWIWDGRFVYVVQADHAIEDPEGVNPQSLLEGAVPQVKAAALELFRVASAKDAEKSNKLANHFLYEEWGFKQPNLYILEDKKALQRLIRDGVVERGLQRDLLLLTNRPLVIRTASKTKSVTLLPRSDQLRDVKSALDWLRGEFREEINRQKLAADDVILIAHHYIAATAAAFATASPDDRNVYVEALWGIPEGLYYYPCDAYLIDTGTPDPSKATEKQKSRFKITARRRFKGQFVAPNNAGRFVVHRTAPPADWSRTITDEVLRDMAVFTRRLAAKEAKRVKVMWFLGCDRTPGIPYALPWYHDFEARLPDEDRDDYKRNKRDQIYYVRTSEDLRKLEKMANDRYKPLNAGRLVVSLDPSEHQVIRSEDFAERVGKAAAKLGAVVELKGGILSHVYYTLERAGADVSAKNQLDFRGNPISMQKLVRDKIPEVVAAAGEVARITQLSTAQRISALKIKLVEEAFEARDAGPQDLLGELADVLEVVDGLARALNIDRTQLEELRARKREQRGGFEEGIFLLETTSKPTPSRDSLVETENGDATRNDGVVKTTRAPPLEFAIPSAFDLRLGDDFVEAVQSAVVRLSNREWTIPSPRNLRLDRAPTLDAVEWVLEGQRQGAQIKLRLRIRLGSRQLTLPLDDSDAGKDLD